MQSKPHYLTFFRALLLPVKNEDICVLFAKHRTFVSDEHTCERKGMMLPAETLQDTIFWPSSDSNDANFNGQLSQALTS